jgi:hypothetical protein
MASSPARHAVCDPTKGAGLPFSPTPPVDSPMRIVEPVGWREGGLQQQGRGRVNWNANCRPQRQPPPPPGRACGYFAQSLPELAAQHTARQRPSRKGRDLVPAQPSATAQAGRAAGARVTRGVYRRPRQTGPAEPS